MNPATDRGARLAAAATTFIGTPFRLHGRNPAIGLDCIGLVCASLIAAGYDPKPPQGYRLRNSRPERWFASAKASGLSLAFGPMACGDIVLIEPGPGQQHVVIFERPDVVIHAHAGLGRVVRHPMLLPKIPLARWRLS